MKPSRERERKRQYLLAVKKSKAKDNSLPNKEPSAPAAINVPALDVFEIKLSQLTLSDGGNSDANRIQTDMRLPVELWKDIFAMASTIPGKDEFSTQSSAYISMACDGTDSEAVPSFSEQTQLIKTRLNIVQVCKYWYSIGIQSLWSHLRLFIHRGMSLKTCVELQKTLQTRPQLGSFVTRLTILAVAYRNLGWVSESVKQILKCTPNLRTLDCPLLLDAYPSSRHYDLIILQLYSAQICQTEWQSAFYQHTRVLNLYLNDTDYLEIPHLELSRLENLTIRAIEIEQEFAIVLSRRWKLPSLQQLSITSPFSMAWSECLRSWAGCLKKLQLNTQESRWERSRSPVNLPELTTLYFTIHSAMVFEGTLTAPKLNRLGFYDIGHLVAPYRFRINQALDAYSTVQQLSLVASDGRELVSPERISAVDLENWKKRGIRVETRSFVIYGS